MAVSAKNSVKKQVAQNKKSASSSKSSSAPKKVTRQYIKGTSKDGSAEYNAIIAAADKKWPNTKRQPGDTRVRTMGSDYKARQAFIEKQMAAKGIKLDGRGNPKIETKDTWTVNGKTYTSKGAAIAAEKKANAAAAKSSASKSSGTTSSASVVNASKGVAPPATKADQVLGGNQKGQVDAPRGGGNVPGVPDAELAEKGAIDVGDTLAPDRTKQALDAYNAQFGSGYQDFTTDLDKAIIAALQGNTAANKFDASRYSNDFLAKYLDPIKSAAGTGTTVSDDPNAVYDFSGAFNDEAINDILDRINSDKISGIRNDFGSQGFGYDENSGASQYSSSLYDKTLDDAWINDILTSQSGLATNALDRALSYGQIGQSGYDYALKELQNQQAAGQGRLTGYGDTLLGDYQSATDEAIKNAYGDIGALSFGSNYDVGGNADRIRNEAQQRLGGFEGDFRQQVGDEQFFDIASLLSKASKGSGLFDPIKSGTAGGFFKTLEDRERARQQSRGLGSQGSF